MSEALTTAVIVFQGLMVVLSLCANRYTDALYRKAKLLADVLETLEPADWEAPPVCRGAGRIPTDLRGPSGTLPPDGLCGICGKRVKLQVDERLTPMCVVHPYEPADDGAEDLVDLRAVTEARTDSSPPIPWEEAKRRLRDDDDDGGGCAT